MITFLWLQQPFICRNSFVCALVRASPPVMNQRTFVKKRQCYLIEMSSVPPSVTVFLLQLAKEACA
jgi:hypothetical protein